MSTRPSIPVPARKVVHGNRTSPVEPAGGVRAIDFPTLHLSISGEMHAFSYQHSQPEDKVNSIAQNGCFIQPLNQMIRAGGKSEVETQIPWVFGGREKPGPKCGRWNKPNTGSASPNRCGWSVAIKQDGRDSNRNYSHRHPVQVLRLVLSNGPDESRPGLHLQGKGGHQSLTRRFQSRAGRLHLFQAMSSFLKRLS